MRMLEVHEKFLYGDGYCLHGAQCGGPNCKKVLGLDMEVSRDSTIHACANVTTSDHCSFILCNSCYQQCIDANGGQIGRKSSRRTKEKGGRYAN